MNKPLAAASLALALGSAVTITSAWAHHYKPRACTNTSRAALTGCLYDGLDDYWIGVGKCNNEKEPAERGECLEEAAAGLKEKRTECRAQRDARDGLCNALGEAPYDPRFEPEDFVDPTTIGGSVAPNPLFPLVAGRTLVYRAENEEVRVEFTGDVRIVDDVPCMVVRDRVFVDGELEEDTLDWFAQDIHGNVWYCGEATAEYVDGFPVDTDGSFEADVDGARPGIIMKAAPAVGDVYRQEFDLDNAEDSARVISLTGTATVPAASCAGSCLVTEEFTPLDPDVLENKFYGPGIGLILESQPDGSGRLELVEIID
jgi:hypothetical protein